MTSRSRFAKTLACLLASSAAVDAFAQAASPAPAAPAEAPAYTLTGNVAVVSDYRFRGISQSYRLPAVQAGFDFTHSSGFYFGNWNSSVSGNSYNNGASLEMDLYGGYRFDLAKDVNADVGLLFYVYPGARLNQSPGVPSDKKYDNAELYAGVTSGPFNAKLSYAVTDYFGLNGETAGYAYFSSLPDRGNSKGTVYMELNYTLDLGDKLTLGAHAGHTVVRHYSELSYTDLKVSLNKEWAGLNFGAAVVGSNAKKDDYQVANAGGLDAKRVGTTTLVLSVGKTF
ncbi:MAG: TorF family putative porin [Burkholderiales bacterium]